MVLLIVSWAECAAVVNLSRLKKKKHNLTKLYDFKKFHLFFLLKQNKAENIDGEVELSFTEVETCIYFYIHISK